MSEENTPQGANTESSSSSETPSIPELEQFVFQADEYSSNVVPRKLEPAKVAKWLLGKIDEKTKLKHFVQVEKVAVFYDSNEVVGKYKQFLDKKESNTEDTKRSIVIARIVGRLGKSEDVEFARQYYNHLIQRADTIEEFQEVIILHEVLGFGGNSAALRQRIKTKLASLETKKDSDYQSRLEYLNFQEKVSNSLTRAEKVQPIEEKILNITDRKQRLEEEIKAYLAIQYGYLEYLQPWAAMRIRRETWASSPAEQILRKDKPPMRGDVIKAFRLFLEKLEKMSLSDKEKESAKLSILRAVKFFGGEVSELEEHFLGLNKGTQADTLANEGFLLE